MLVNKYFGVGVLAAIAQKTAIEYFIGLERQIDNNVVNMFVGWLNRNPIQQQNNELNTALQKIIDSSLPILTFGNAFINPGISSVLALGHIFTKYKIPVYLDTYK